MQRLLRAADWDIGRVRDDVRDYVIEHLGDPEARAGRGRDRFPEDGREIGWGATSVLGTAGRTENCQIGVFLAYASQHGHALIDREPYLPQSWTSDRDRCRDGGKPPVMSGVMSTSAVPPDRQQLIDDVALSKYMMDDLDPDDPKWDEHYSGLRDWLHATFAVGAMTGVVFGDDDVVAEVFRAYNALVEDRAHAPSVRYTNEYLAAGIARARALMDACPDPGCESLCHRLQGRVDLLMAMQRARAIP